MESRDKDHNHLNNNFSTAVQDILKQLTNDVPEPIGKLLSAISSQTDANFNIKVTDLLPKEKEANVENERRTCETTQGHSRKESADRNKLMSCSDSSDATVKSDGLSSSRPATTSKTEVPVHSADERREKNAEDSSSESDEEYFDPEGEEEFFEDCRTHCLQTVEDANASSGAPTCEDLIDDEEEQMELQRTREEEEENNGELLPCAPPLCNPMLASILEDAVSNPPRIVAHKVDNFHSGHRFDFHFTILKKENHSDLDDQSSSLSSASLDDSSREENTTSVPQLSELSQWKKCEPEFKTFQECLRNSYSNESSYMSSFHWKHGEHALSIKHYYILPNICETYGNTRLRSNVTLDQMFSCDLEGTMPPKRILLTAESGGGKTALFTKLAYDWAVLEDSVNYLSNFEVVLIVNLRKLSTTSLEEELVKRILSSSEKSDQNITEEDALFILKKKADKILLLLDGCDEYYTEEEILNFTSSRFSKNMQWMKYTTIVLSSRPLAAKKITRLFQRSLQIQGFSFSQKETFAERYFGEDKEKYHSLQNHLNSKDNRINTLAENPLMLTLICLLHEKDSLESVLGRGQIKHYDVCDSFLYLLMHSILSEHDVEIQEMKFGTLYAAVFSKLGTIFIINMMISKFGQPYVAEEDNSIELTLLKDMGVLRKISSNQYDVVHSAFIEYGIALVLSNVTDMEKVAHFLANLCIKINPDFDSVEVGKFTINTDDGEVKYRLFHLDAVIQIVRYMEGMLDNLFPLLVEQLKKVSFLCSLMKEYFPHLSVITCIQDSQEISVKTTTEEDLLQSIAVTAKNNDLTNTSIKYGDSTSLSEGDTESEVPQNIDLINLDVTETTATLTPQVTESSPDSQNRRTSYSTCLSECSSEAVASNQSVSNSSILIHDATHAVPKYLEPVLSQGQNSIKNPTIIKELAIDFNDIKDKDLWKCYLDTLLSEDFIVQSVRMVWHQLPVCQTDEFHKLCEALENSKYLDIIIVHIYTDFTAQRDPEKEAETYCEVIMKLFKLNALGELLIQLEMCFEHNSSLIFIPVLNDYVKRTDLSSSRRRQYCVTDGIQRHGFTIQCSNE